MKRAASRPNVSLDPATHERLRKKALKRSLTEGKRVTISSLIRDWSKRLK